MSTKLTPKIVIQALKSVVTIAENIFPKFPSGSNLFVGFNLPSELNMVSTFLQFGQYPVDIATSQALSASEKE